MAKEIKALMMNKRIMIYLMILTVAVASATLVDFFSEKMDEKTSGIWLCDKGIGGIEEVSIFDSERQLITSYKKTNNAWESAEGIPLLKNDMAGFLTVMGYMRIKSEVNRQTGQTYGLGDSSYSIGVKYKNGESYTIHTGLYIDGLGMYVSMENDSRVYLLSAEDGKVVSNAVKDAVGYSLDKIKYSSVRGITIRRDGKEIVINRSEAPRAGKDFYWNMFQPFQWEISADWVKSFVKTVQQTVLIRNLEVEGISDKTEIGQISIYDSNDEELRLSLYIDQDKRILCKTNTMQGLYQVEGDITKIPEISICDILDNTFYYFEKPSVKSLEIILDEKYYMFNADWKSGRKENENIQEVFLNDIKLTAYEYEDIVKWFSDTKVANISTKKTTDDERGIKEGEIHIKRLSSPYDVNITIYSIGDENERLVEYDNGISAKIKNADLIKLLNVLENTAESK